MNTITYEEDLIKENFNFLKGVNKFFTATSTRVELDKFQTDILMSGGMDPWRTCDISDYPLYISYKFLIKICLALMILI